MNNNTKEKLKKVGLFVPTILLPRDGINLTKWSVVACDQFTSDRSYWQKVEEYIGLEPSTAKITFAEVYLEDEDKNNRIQKINYLMEKYLKDGILEEKFEGWVLVDRQTKITASRKGLVVALDLEKYDFHKGSKTLIRATEGTVESRIPPRLAIRSGAPIELPHIMVLINDPEKTVIEPLFAEKLDRIYDFELMMEGGRVRGRKVVSEELLDRIATNLEKLISKDGLLYAMGDGNHSLATAKAHWDNIKKDLNDKELETHPARYALVELVNIHDEGLKFEPIHRVVFNVDPNELRTFLLGDYSLVDMITSEKEHWGLGLRNLGSNLVVGNLQLGLDEYVRLHPEVKIDYIHGEDQVNKLVVEGKGTVVGFILPGMKKEELFTTVEKDGALPRKTFSMGEATEKRYYLEAKKIK